MALIVGLLALLTVIAVDFGRVFFGWVGVHNATRVAANFAATHHEANWASPADPDVMDYVEMVQNDARNLNCNPTPLNVPSPTFTDETGTPVADPQFGDIATVTLECSFRTFVPMGPFNIAAASSFPIRAGVIEGVPVGGTIPTPPPTCKNVPDLTGLTVSLARAQWSAAGFSGAVIPASGDDTDVVSAQATNPASTPGQCITPIATVSLTHAPPTPGCSIVPNMVGLTVLEARDAWDDALFTGSFTPATGSETRIVDTQTTSPAASPGDCVDPTTSATVTHVAPPIPDCEVPELLQVRRNSANGIWQGPPHSFTTSLVINPGPGNYKIGSQSLVGGSMQPCNSVMTVGP